MAAAGAAGGRGRDMRAPRVNEIPLLSSPLLACCARIPGSPVGCRAASRRGLLVDRLADFAVAEARRQGGCQSFSYTTAPIRSLELRRRQVP
jgi:hypothetical protein